MVFERGFDEQQDFDSQLKRLEVDKWKSWHKSFKDDKG